MRHTIYEKRINPTLWRDPIPVDPEQIPVLGREDYEARIQVLWQMPQASEYDTILIYGDREHFSNVEYFTGYDPRWEETLLILPQRRKAVDSGRQRGDRLHRRLSGGDEH